jgi:hypothetical protein
MNYFTSLGDCSPHDISVEGEKVFVIGFLPSPDFYYTFTGVGFAMGIDTSGGKILFYHYLAGDSVGYSTGSAIAVDGRGAVYALFILDWPANLYISDDAFQESWRGGMDLYICKLKTTNGSILYATYMGGVGSDNGTDLVVDSFGSAYVTGNTTSFDFPTTAGAYSTLYGGKSSSEHYSREGDAFIARIRDSGPAGELLLNKTKLKFRAPYQSTDVLTKRITLQNKGKGIVNYDITTGQDWLKAWPLDGDVRNEKDTLYVSADPAGLKPGTHQGLVKVSSIDAFNSPHQALVTFKVGGPAIKLKRKKFSFDAVEGDTAVITRESTIRNKGGGTLNYRLKPKTSWLRVTPRRGKSTGEWDTYTIKVRPAGLEAGIHQGTIEVSSNDTVDSPVLITVTLNIKAE